MAVDHEINTASLVRNLEEFFARESCGWRTPCRDEAAVERENSACAGSVAKVSRAISKQPQQLVVAGKLSPPTHLVPWSRYRAPSNISEEFEAGINSRSAIPI